MEPILKQRVVGAIVVIAILSIILPAIVISKDEAFNKKLISNIPPKPVFKIDLPEERPVQTAHGAGHKNNNPADRRAETADTAVKYAASKEAATKKQQPRPQTDKQAKTVALRIPLTDTHLSGKKSDTKSANKSDAKSVATPARGNTSGQTRQRTANPEARVAHNGEGGNGNLKSASKDALVSPPKGKLDMPNLTEISKALEDFTKRNQNSQKNTAKRPVQQAHVGASTSVSKIKSGWVVQVGSFSKKSNAVTLNNKLKKRGHKSFVETINGKNGVIYRVRIGPQKDQAVAKSLQQKILKQDRLEAIVLRYSR